MRHVTSSSPFPSLLSLLREPGPTPILEAHNGLSARIAAEAGFPAVWASGLSISAALGVRDSNEASWTQVLEVVEFMADAAGVPVLVDGDTGFGNFNNFRRVVRKLGERGAAGVCIEDKLFPKTNSFLNGTAQPLAPVEEFCGKIKAGLDARTQEDFVLVARTEALIAGWGVEEALRRAEAYRAAGAHAVVVHSAAREPDEVFAFLAAWQNRLPVILIPTKYVHTPVEAFAERKVAGLIWANHLLRASVSAMQGTAAEIRRTGTASAVEDYVAPLSEVFRLQNAAELSQAERRYLPPAPARQAVVLAATRGSGPLEVFTEDKPKTLLRVGGESLLDRLCDQFKALRVNETVVVAGYCKEAIKRAGVVRVDNDAWAETGELTSLAMGLEGLSDGGETLVAFGDVVCRRHLWDMLVSDAGDVVIVADRRRRRGARDRIRLADALPSAFLDASACLVGAAYTAAGDEWHAEWTGQLKLSPRGTKQVKAWLEAARQRPDFARLGMVDLFAGLAESGQPVTVQLVTEGWTTVEDALDLVDASNV